jgi:hypothetical protein
MVGDALLGVRIATTKSPSAEMLINSNNPADFWHARCQNVKLPMISAFLLGRLS